MSLVVQEIHEKPAALERTLRMEHSTIVRIKKIAQRRSFRLVVAEVDDRGLAALGSVVRCSLGEVVDAQHPVPCVGVHVAEVFQAGWLAHAGYVHLGGENQCGGKMAGHDRTGQEQPKPNVRRYFHNLMQVFKPTLYLKSRITIVFLERCRAIVFPVAGRVVGTRLSTPGEDRFLR